MVTASEMGSDRMNLLFLSWQNLRTALSTLIVLVSLATTAWAHQLQEDSTWTESATNISGVQLGDPITLTWGFVPDGTPSINSSTGPSNVIEWLDDRYGAGVGGGDYTARPWFPLFESSFDRWSNLSGLSYQYEPFDNGSLHGGPTATGVLGVRADVRIAGGYIDGPSNVLAYNYFPSTSGFGGDMMFDTSESYNPTNEHRAFRNVIMHEHGHGIGISHVESTNGRFLMEPSLSTQFSGPQLDDILAAQRGYGDFYEKNGGNDTAVTATPLGVATLNQPLVIGSDASRTTVAETATDFVSIDDDSDVDYWSFTTVAPGTVTIQLEPLGPTYNEGPQNEPQSPYDTSSFSDLAVQLFDSDGVTQLAVDNSGGPGDPDQISQAVLPSGGEFFVRVSGAADNIQMYELSIDLTSQTFVGDFDGNGIYDCADVDSLVGEIASGLDTPSFDINADGTVDQQDLDRWLAEAGAVNNSSGSPYLLGDANLDGIVDVSDRNVWNSAQFTSGAGWCGGDFNASGSTDVTDLNIWTTNKFRSSDSVMLVPEPTGLQLMLLAPVALLALRKHGIGRSSVA